MTSLYTVNSKFSSTHVNTVITVLPSSSIYSTATGTMKSMEYTKTSLSISMKSTVSTQVATSESTGSNTLILAAVISTVFILLVVTIVVILIVSVLVYRRRWYITSNGNDTFSSDERKADINQQSDGNVY